MIQVFAVIASMEFIYIEAPQYMKSFAMGIYFFTWTVGDTVAVCTLNFQVRVRRTGFGGVFGEITSYLIQNETSK